MPVSFKSAIDCGEVRVIFSAKPDERIRGMLKAAGFRWSPAVRLWWRRRVAGAADFLAALDRALNPGRPDGACWRCHSPDGFFRPFGAATPVYCDACYAIERDARNGTRADPVDLAYEDSCRDACGL
jgi:hypothetical protein